MRPTNLKAQLIRLFLLAWGLQVLWLGWHFYPETQDLAVRLLHGKTGQAVRQEDPFYRWLMELSKVMPPQAAYVFLDRYEKGREIEARYHLYPRRHLLGAQHLLSLGFSSIILFAISINADFVKCETSPGFAP